MNKAEITVSIFIEAREKTAIMFHKAKIALYQMALFVQMLIIGTWRNSTRSWWNLSLSAALFNMVYQRVGIIPFVGQDNVIALITQQGLSLRDVMTVTASKNEAHRIAERIGQGMYFSREATAGTP